MALAKSLPGFISSALSNRAKKSPSSAWKSRKKIFAKFYGSNGHEITNGSGYDTSYNVPNPGITGIDVKFKGSLGSLREVTVNYKCWSKSQLAQMAKAYMQLGRSAAVVFGWTITDGGSRVAGLPKMSGNSMADAFTAAKSAASSNSGCVAGYKGIVDNFTFELDSDGSFNCMCHFVTMGEAALDMDMDIDKPEGNGCESMAEDKTEKNSNAIQAIKNEITYVLRDPVGGRKGKSGYVTIEREQTDEEKDNRSWGQSFTAFFGESFFQMDTVYLSWKWIEENMLEGAMFPQKAGKPVYKIDSSGVTINNTPLVFCADPLIGFIHGHSAITMGKSFGEISGGDVWNKANKLKTVQDLWFNANWLIEKVKESEKLEDFIQNVLQGMNNASGNVWDLVVVIDEDDPAMIKIVDAGKADGTTGAKELIMYGPNSVATNVTIDTQVPNGIKASLLYGANSKSGEGGNKESGEFRFQPGNDSLTPELNGTMEQPAVDCKDSGVDESTDSPEEVFLEALEDCFSGVEPTTTDKVKSSYYNLPSIKTIMEKDQDGEDVLIPINMSFDVEGIEGIPYGAMIQGNYIPGVYKSAGSFMVTGVSHKVSDTGWTTSIETIFRRKN